MSRCGRRMGWLLGVAILLCSPVCGADGWLIAPDPVVREAVPSPQESLRRALPVRPKFMAAPQFPSDFVLIHPHDGETVVWSLSTGQRTGGVPSRLNVAKSEWMVLNPPGTRAAFAANGFSSSAVDVWDTTRGKLLHRLDPGANARGLNFMEFAGENHFVISPGKDGNHSFTLWNLTTGEVERTLLTPVELTDGAVSVSPGGKYVAVAGRHKNLVLIFDLTTGQLMQQLPFKGTVGFWENCQGLAFSPDGTQLAGLFQAAPSHLRMWDLQTGDMTIEASIAADPHGNLHGRPSYNGRKFTWIPDGSGWLCYGYFWIDRATQRLVRDLRFGTAPLVSALHPVSPNLVAYCAGDYRASKLMTQPLPPVPQITANEEPRPLLRTGDAIALDVQMGAVRIATEENVKKSLGDALSQRLNQLGFTAETGARLRLQMTYREEAGASLPRPKPQNTLFLPGGSSPGNAGAGQGTGFVVTAAGHVVTCAHVVAKAEHVTVKLGNRKLKAVVLERNEKTDLALLKFAGENEAFLPLRDSDKFELGEEVRAVGYPLSDVLGETVKITKGTLAGQVRRDSQNLFMVDATLNPGNSGGPLIDQSGSVLGVNSCKLVGREIERVGMSIPVNQIKALFETQKLSWTAGAVPQAAPLTGAEFVKQVSASVALILPPGAAESALSEESAIATNITAELSLHVEGRPEPVWKESISDNSRILAVQGPWNESSLRNAVFGKILQRLRNLSIPYYLSADGQVQLPQIVTLPLIAE